MNTARFLKYIWLFFNIMYERIKLMVELANDSEEFIMIT